MESFKFLGFTGWEAVAFLAVLCIIVALIVVNIIFFSGKGVNSEQTPKEEKYRRFYYIGMLTIYKWYGIHKDILVDRETRVQYFAASMAPWVDENGKPILYTGNFDDAREGYE